MFDFVGEYVDWATRDGWSASAFLFLALAVGGIALIALVALTAAATAGRWLVEGVRVGMSDDPTSTRELFEAKRAERRRALDE